MSSPTRFIDPFFIDVVHFVDKIYVPRRRYRRLVAIIESFVLFFWQKPRIIGRPCIPTMAMHVFG
jgi:hypothetical protein